MQFSDIWSVVEIGFDAVGVLVLTIGAALALITFMRTAGQKHSAVAGRSPYQQLRAQLGRAILLGLELLVAADIIHSVTVNPTFTSIGVLGLIVVVRTFLSWSLEVEIEGQWPWRRWATRSRTERHADV